MDDLISVLIADDNSVFCDVLCEYLNRCDDIVVKGVARDGLEALKMIKELLPEIVVLDLIMPNLDGIGVLERISEMHLKREPIFVMLTAIGKDIFIQKTIELGAEYYILKPFDIDVLVSRIRQIHKEKTIAREKMAAMTVKGEKSAESEKCCFEYIITGLIKGLGIQPNVIGYHYLREAVILSMENKSIHNSTMKRIYTEIAEKHHTSTKNIARGIRCAVDNAYKVLRCADGIELNKVIDLNKEKKPTNVQLITLLAEKARLEMKLHEKNARIN